MRSTGAVQAHPLTFAPLFIHRQVFKFGPFPAEQVRVNDNPPAYAWTHIGAQHYKVIGVLVVVV
jgi:hypothetical protein